jgi:HSP20 family protein
MEVRIDREPVPVGHRGSKEDVMAQLVRWQPVRELEGLVDDFERWLGLASWRRARVGDGGFSPACEVVENDEATVLRFDLPGVDPERELEVSVEGDTLVVRGERRHTEETASYRESAYGRFERCLTLPRGSDPARIAAHYDRGVLEVTVPRTSAVEATKVPVTHVALGTEAPSTNAAA